MVKAPLRGVAILGVGLHPFGRFPDKTLPHMARTAVLEALKDAGVRFRDIQIAYFGQVYYEGMSMGEVVLRALGLTTIPVVNVENACASSSTAFWQAYWGIASGLYDIALAFGAERVPRGPVSVTGTASRQHLLGADHMMAGYALRMRRYMHDFGAPVEAIAQVAVKAHRNATLNPYAQYQKVFTLEEVLTSRMIAEPLTLYQCCPTSEGASAAVLCAQEAVSRYTSNPERAIPVVASVLRTTPYQGPRVDNPSLTTVAAQEAYEMAGLGPEDVDVVQVHDAATIGEIEQIEHLGLVRRGEGWIATREGRTEIGGDIPVNTDGGLQAMGHPFGATGVRMLHELVMQLRWEAGPRQVRGARVGLAQCSGAGGVCTVHILKR
ncbi:MAG: thiolase family protein [Dehalococcoidia bacterium]